MEHIVIIGNGIVELRNVIFENQIQKITIVSLKLSFFSSALMYVFIAHEV
jgi:hypothetical protein